MPSDFLTFDAFVDSRNAKRLARRPLDIDDSATNTHGTLGHRKVPRQAIHEAFDDGLMVAAEAGIVWPTHPGVTKESGSSGKNTLVSRLDMGVGADDGGNFSVEKPAHRDLFAGGFGVHIDDDRLEFPGALVRPPQWRRGRDCPEWAA